MTFAGATVALDPTYEWLPSDTAFSAFFGISAGLAFLVLLIWAVRSLLARPRTELPGEPGASGGG
jgi:hypothetical protein